MIKAVKDNNKTIQEKKLWVDVISGNRDPTNGMAIEFIALKLVNGEIEIEIKEKDIESKVKYWELTLIMHVLGGDLSMNTVKQYTTKFWNFLQLPDMFYNKEGYFILSFNSMRDTKTVFMKRPLTIYNMLMLLREWKQDFSLKRDMLRMIPI